jgi:hypothetical protein
MKIESTVFTNRDFMDLTQEEVHRLSVEQSKNLDDSLELPSAMQAVEEEYGPEGDWQDHWVTLDTKGTRVYTRMYLSNDASVALDASGNIVRVERF